MATLSEADVKACNHPRLRARFILALVLAILLVPLFVVLALVSVVTLLLFWGIFFVWLTAEIFFAYMVSNSILVSELNYPRIDALAAEMKAQLSVRRDFSVFVYEHGQFNAGMRRLFRRRAIFLNSEILETGVSDDEVRWLIGRFVGYWRSQQDAGIAGWMIRAAQKALIFNFFIMPYERAMVYTGDRMGLAAIGGDIGSAISAMQKLLVGRQLGYSVNPVGVVEQRRQTKGSLFAFLSRLTSGFPPTVARYVDMIAFARRHFPGAYGRFEAANPGLPADLDALSGEHTSSASLGKGLAFLGAMLVAALITMALWGKLAGMVGDGASLFPMPSAIPAETPAPDTTTPPQPPPAQQQPAPQPPPPPPPPQQPAQRVINGAIFAQQPTAADYDAVYPAAARLAGISGTADMTCQINNDGTLYACQATAETPPGSGFGAAAVRLAPTIRLAPQTQDGTPVAGGTIPIHVPFQLTPR